MISSVALDSIAGSFWSVLCCTMLCCTSPCSTIVCCIKFRRIVWCYTAHYCAVLLLSCCPMFSQAMRRPPLLCCAVPCPSLYGAALYHVLRYAVLCCAMSCAVLCHVLCYAVLRYAVLRFAMPCTMPCYAMLCYAVLCCATLCHVLRYAPLNLTAVMRHTGSRGFGLLHCPPAQLRSAVRSGSC